MKIRYLLFFLMTVLFACKKTAMQSDTNTYQPPFIDHFIDDWACAVNPGTGANFDVAEFRLWIPDTNDVSEVKAILILTEGSNSNATNMTYSDEWRAYAIANKIALMGVHMESRNSQPVFDTYANASGGSGEALIKALEAITTKNNVPYIAALPFLLRGYSAGGMFSYFFSDYQPKRVVAFADIRGWVINQNADETKEIPGLFLIGEMDMPLSSQRDMMQQMIQSKRKQDGLWTYGIEPNADHFAGLAASDSLIKLFFSSALKYRLSTASNDLLTIAPASGWLGNNDTKSIFPYAVYPDEKEKAGWLIDEVLAKAWKEFQKK
jgi:hypothetical protein